MPQQPRPRLAPCRRPFYIVLLEMLAKQRQLDRILQAYNDARGILGLLLTKKIDTATYKTAIANIEKSIEAVKTISSTNTSDTWTKITTPSLEAFLKGARDAESKITDKGLPSDAFLQLVNTFTAVIEGKHRALSRSLIAKGQTIEPRGGSGMNRRLPMPSGHPEMPKAPHVEQH